MYDPKQKDNEEQSSQVFGEYANLINLEQSQASLVHRIIMATVKHSIDENLFQDKEERKVCEVFLDADLSVLGWEPVDYDEYSYRIWQEYSYYGWEGYCKGRA